MEKQCTIDGCYRTYLAKGMCSLHYGRMKRGYPLDAPTTELERFLAKVSAPNQNGCHEWTGYRNNKGYGEVHIGGRKGRVIAAHRYSYQTFISPISEGLLVCHYCDNPPCVNPYHLFLGTNKDNSDDKHFKDRANMPSKENHWKAKLTSKDIEMIRLLYSTGTFSQRSLSRLFKTTQSNIWYILNHKTWTPA